MIFFQPIKNNSISEELTDLLKMRNIHIDLLKGFAIVLVVVGHSIQTLTNNDFENPLFKFI